MVRADLPPVAERYQLSHALGSIRISSATIIAPAFPGGRCSRPRPINVFAMPYPSTGERARAAVFCRRGNPRLFRTVTNAGLAPVHCRRTRSQPLDHTKR